MLPDVTDAVSPAVGLTHLQIAAAVISGAAVTYVLRAVPLLCLRKRVENPFLISLLRLLPYGLLSAMIFPDIFSAADSTAASSAGFFAAAAAASLNAKLTCVALAACAAAYIFLVLAQGG